MGVNNKRRRAAKQKTRAKQRAQQTQPRPTAPTAGSTRDFGDFGFSEDFGATDDFRAPGSFADIKAQQAFANVELHVTATIRRLARQRPDMDDLRVRTGVLLRQVGPASADLVPEVLGEVLVSIVGGTVRGGWDPGDLAQLVARRDQAWSPMLAAALHEHSRSEGRADAHWRSAIQAIAREERLLLDGRDSIAVALGLAALLAGVPLLEERAFTESLRAAHGTVEHPKWHQVRGLLAKAESTDFGPEAEAMVAKAQELISRYSLERMLDAEHVVGDAARTPVPRRLWLDKPYVRAKGALVHQVASANRCRAALAEQHGFVMLMGHQSDLEAVELLVTSLLVQADAAMLRLGRGDAAGPRGRSRSFRQSFLMAYALRIGERLQAADETAVAEHAAALPVLRDHQARVADAFEAMVPHTVGRGVNITDHAGWEAGTAAADLALLDVHGRLAGDSPPATRAG